MSHPTSHSYLSSSRKNSTNKERFKRDFHLLLDDGTDHTQVKHESNEDEETKRSRMVVQEGRHRIGKKRGANPWYV